AVLQRERLVGDPGRLPADPELDEYDGRAVESLVQIRGPRDPTGVAVGGEEARGERADHVESVRCRVDQPQPLDHGRRPHARSQSRDPVGQFRRVPRPAADYCDLHPFTPVSVTPCTKAFWAKKKRTTTGIRVSMVAA